MTNAVCKGVCKSIPHDLKNIKRYKDGQKFCGACVIWVKTINHRCACCNEILRTKSRCKKDEDRWKNAY